jgi:hypothetical protein
VIYTCFEECFSPSRAHELGKSFLSAATHRSEQSLFFADIEGDKVGFWFLVDDKRRGREICDIYFFLGNTSFST